MTIIHGESYKAPTDWLDPLNRAIIQRVVKHELASCKLRDGRRFLLTYDSGVVTVRIDPKYGHAVPYGTFNVKKVLEDLWIDGENKKGVATL